MELQSLLIAALTGFISGLILCIPVGPINLIILNEGARRGFRWALMIGFGATVMEMIYCFVAFSSFASIFSKGKIEFYMRLLGSAFTLIFGIKFLLAKSVDAPLHLTARAEALGHRLEEKLHPRSAFTTGFVRVLANPGVLVGWIVLGSVTELRNYIAHPERYTLGSPVDAIGMLSDVAEIINWLWGHDTEGGRLFPAPVARRYRCAAISATAPTR